MRIFCTIAASVIIALLIASILNIGGAAAHSGRTDSNGCHSDRNGYYHAHNPVRACPAQSAPEMAITVISNALTIFQTEPSGISFGNVIAIARAYYDWAGTAIKIIEWYQEATSDHSTTKIVQPASRELDAFDLGEAITLPYEIDYETDPPFLDWKWVSSHYVAHYRMTLDGATHFEGSLTLEPKSKIDMARRPLPSILVNRFSCPGPNQSDLVTTAWLERTGRYKHTQLIYYDIAGAGPEIETKIVDRTVEVSRAEPTTVRIQSRQPWYIKDFYITPRGELIGHDPETGKDVYAPTVHLHHHHTEADRTGVVIVDRERSLSGVTPDEVWSWRSIPTRRLSWALEGQVVPLNPEGQAHHHEAKVQGNVNDPPIGGPYSVKMEGDVGAIDGLNHHPPSSTGVFQAEVGCPRARGTR